MRAETEQMKEETLEQAGVNKISDQSRGSKVTSVENSIRRSYIFNCPQYSTETPEGFSMHDKTIRSEREMRYNKR